MSQAEPKRRRLARCPLRARGSWLRVALCALAHARAPMPPASSAAAAAAAAAAAENVRLARLFFLGGLLALPWLWAASLLHFRREAARLLLPAAWCAAGPPPPPDLARWLRRSLAGLAVATAAFAAWVAAFHAGFASWPWGPGLLVWQPDPAWWND